MSILTCFFLTLIPYAASITFNFTNITPLDSQYIIFSGDATYASDDGIQVTHERISDRNSSWLAGRAIYNKSLHLWDKDSTDLASFSTSFTFVIDSYESGYYADGLTFFLAQNNSVMINGGAMGLPFDSHINTSIHPFVAVEFDTYGNTYDPIDPATNFSIGHHVGININSMTSVVYRKWLTNIEHGHECEALISYFSDSNNLSVSFTNFKDNLLVWETGFYYSIDLRDVLPEKVIFGFSASTGVWSEKNSVRSWIFNSSELKVDQISSLPPTTSPNAMKGNKQIWLIVGSIAGTSVPVTILAILTYSLWRKKKNNGDEGEHGSALEINNEFEMGAAIPRRFSYLELAQSTADFAVKDPVPFQTIIPLKMNTHKVKGLLKGLRYISQVFEEEKKQEIQIGGPTDVKHVAHFGCDGQAQESPSWMRGFGTPAQSQSASSNLLEAPSHDGSDWVSEADTGQRMSRRERQEKLKSKHRRHRSVENAPDPDSQTKSRQPRRHHTRGPEGRRAQDESLTELPKRTRKKKPTDDVNPQASAVANAEK